MSILGKNFNKRADPCMGVLYIVDRVFTVLADGQIQVELKMCVRFCVKEETACVNADLVKKVI